MKQPSLVPAEILLPRLVIPLDDVPQGCCLETVKIIFTKEDYTIAIDADITYRTKKGREKKLITLTKQLQVFVYKNQTLFIIKKATIGSRIKVTKNTDKPAAEKIKLTEAGEQKVKKHKGAKLNPNV